MSVRVFITIFCLGVTSNAFAQSQNTPPDFYQDKERGWFWFEDPEVVEDEPEKKPSPPTPSPSKTETKDDEKLVRLDVKWLKEKIPEVRDAAINNPTNKNIARFLYAQRYMLDMATRFSTRAVEFSKFEAELDESRRRPMNTLSLNAFKDQTKNAISEVISNVNSKAHLWFFFSSDCSYCVQQISVLKELQIRFDIDVLAISLDGGRLPGLEQFETVVDTAGVAEQFNVRYTPTIILAENEGKGFARLGEGLTSLPTLQDRLLVGARMQNIITNKQYQLTQDVREINVLTDVDGTMLADADLLEKDPGYLAEILKSKLGVSSPAGSNTYNGLPEESK